MVRKALSVLVVLPVLSVAAPDTTWAQNCRAIGSSYFCTDGRSGQRSATSPSLNNQSRTSPLGNQRYTNPQKRATDPGNALFPSDPTSTRRLGDTTYNRDGSKCRTVGTTMTCQ